MLARARRRHGRTALEQIAGFGAFYASDIQLFADDEQYTMAMAPPLDRRRLR
jgi:hypothetical protein